MKQKLKDNKEYYEQLNGSKYYSLIKWINSFKEKITKIN